MIDCQFLALAGVDKENMALQLAHRRLDTRLKYLDKHLKSDKYLAGDNLSAADIMTVR